MGSSGLAAQAWSAVPNIIGIGEGVDPSESIILDALLQSTSSLDQQLSMIATEGTAVLVLRGSEGQTPSLLPLAGIADSNISAHCGVWEFETDKMLRMLEDGVAMGVSDRPQARDLQVMVESCLTYTPSPSMPAEAHPRLDRNAHVSANVSLVSLVELPAVGMGMALQLSGI